MVVTFPPMTTRNTDLRVVYPPTLTPEQSRLRELEDEDGAATSLATPPGWLQVIAVAGAMGLVIFVPPSLVDYFTTLVR
jgi:hypothetical protein